VPFVSRFQESAEAEIIDSILTVVHRDFKDALDYFYVADNLPAFAVMTLGDISVFNYPLLVVGPERMTSVEADSGEYLNQDLKVGAGVVVQDSSVALVKRKAMKYVRAFKAVLRTATTADLFPATNLMFDHIIDIDHQYLRHGTKETLYTQPVEFEITFRFGEK